jgi:hypothetical protein
MILRTYHRIGAAVLAVTAVVAIGTRVADAQYPIRGPGGSIGIPNQSGTVDYYYPSYFDAQRNTVMPGTRIINTPSGQMWVSQDGQVRSNHIDAFGNRSFHYHAHAQGGAGNPQYQSNTGSLQYRSSTPQYRSNMGSPQYRSYTPVR